MHGKLQINGVTAIYSKTVLKRGHVELRAERTTCKVSKEFSIVNTGPRDA